MIGGTLPKTITVPEIIPRQVPTNGPITSVAPGEPASFHAPTDKDRANPQHPAYRYVNSTSRQNREIFNESQFLENCGDPKRSCFHRRIDQNDLIVNRDRAGGKRMGTGQDLHQG